MTLTAVVDRRAPSPGAPVDAPRPSHQRRATTTRPTIVVTMQVTLDGDTPDPVAALRELAQRVVGMGDLTVVSPVRLAEAPQPIADPISGPLAEFDLVASPASSPPRPDEVRIDVRARSVTKGDEEITLCRREFDLLLFFAEHHGQVFTRRQLLSAVWGDPFTGERTIDVHITRLRHKLGNQQPMITTVRGVGYRLADNAPITVVDSVAPAPAVPWTPRPVGPRVEYAVPGAA